MDVSANNNLRTNYLIFEIDLSDVAYVDDLELAFDRSDHGEEDNANDRVWIRGNSGDSWIEIYNFRDNDV